MNAFIRYLRWLQFWRRVDVSGDCWVMDGAERPNTIGYKKFKYGVETLSHRSAYLMFNGDIGDKCVLHKCDNPACVKPTHLFLGTQLDNIRDMDAKGRRNPPRGDEHWTRRRVLT